MFRNNTGPSWKTHPKLPTPGILSPVTCDFEMVNLRDPKSKVENRDLQLGQKKVLNHLASDIEKLK